MSRLADQLYEPAASPADLLHVHSGHSAPCSACVGTPCPFAGGSLTAAMSPPGGQKEKNEKENIGTSSKKVRTCVCLCIWQKSTSLLSVFLSLVSAAWFKSSVSSRLANSFSSVSKLSRSLWSAALQVNVHFWQFKHWVVTVWRPPSHTSKTPTRTVWLLGSCLCDSLRLGSAVWYRPIQEPVSGSLAPAQNAAAAPPRSSVDTHTIHLYYTILHLY